MKRTKKLTTCASVTTLTFLMHGGEHLEAEERNRRVEEIMGPVNPRNEKFHPAYAVNVLEAGCAGPVD